MDNTASKLTPDHNYPSLNPVLLELKKVLLVFLSIRWESTKVIEITPCLKH